MQPSRARYYLHRMGQCANAFYVRSKQRSLCDFRLVCKAGSSGPGMPNLNLRSYLPRQSIFRILTMPDPSPPGLPTRIVYILGEVKTPQAT